MDAATAIRLAVAASDIVAGLIQHAREQGATPEEVQEARRRAIERYDLAAQAVRDAEPPQPA